MSLPLVLPVLIPLGSAALGLLAWRSVRAQGWLCAAGALGLLASSIALLLEVRREGVRVTQVGGWPAPFGVTLVADVFSAVMVVLAGLIGAAVAFYSVAAVDLERKRYGYFPLLQMLLAGVCGAFLTGDLFNLYVWFEVMLISSFVLLGLGGERPQLEGAIKYVSLNLISSAFFLAAVGILYGLVGTLNLADLSVKLAGAGRPGLIVTTAVLFLVAFGIKAAIFPFFFWLPAAYHTPPAAVSALFAGLLTKVGVYSLIRVFTLLFTQDVPYTHGLLLAVAGVTMVTGVLGAVAQMELRRLLAFHIVSQIGYMVMGLGLFTPLALAGSIFFVAHNILAKSSLFLISGVAHRLLGTYELKQLGGLYATRAGLSALFLISALSLAGVPPLPGFFGKLTLVRAGLELREYPVVITALGVSLLTLLSMTKIWNEAFWKPGPLAEPAALRASERVLLMAPIVALAAVTSVISLAPGLLFDLAVQAATQLRDPSEYVSAVLGGRGR